jgi:hypothetical protein
MSKRLISLIVGIVFLSSPVTAQRRPAPPRKPAAPAPAPRPAPERTATFDTILAADSYRIYSEVRGVGQLIRSPALTDLLDPVMKLGGPPKEFKTILKWLNAQADTLAGSRMFAASWPVQPKLPTVLIAIEFDSAEEAQKFDPKLRRFVPTLLPTLTPTPVPDQVPSGLATVGTPSSAPAPESRPELPPYVIRQSGSLILISDKPFALKDLAPRGTKLLSEDQNFATARNRLASEPVFVYVDLKLIEKEQEEQQKKFEEEMKNQQLEAANQPTPEETAVEPDLEMTTQVQPIPSSTVPEPSPPGEFEKPQNPPADPAVTPPPADEPTLSAGPDLSMFSLTSLLFGGSSKWAEAVGVAVALEGDAYVLRVLVINGADNKASAIPFVPQFISGPALVPESPNIFPSDSDFFFAVSLDYPQVYEGMLKSLEAADEMVKKYGGRPVSAPAPLSPFAVVEQRMGIKIKEDLLPLLGNELALALPPLPKQTPAPPDDMKQPAAPGSEDRKKGPPPAPPDPSLVIALSIKDRDAVRRLLPKIIDSLGFKGASLIAQTEKRDDTEIVSYGGAFSYAFMGNFLVISPDPAATRHVVNSFLNHQTLASDSHFRNSIRWQPRQLLGQVYVAPDLVERYYPLAMAGSQGQEALRTFLSRLSPVLDPVSYALTNDGLGPLHELHVPRNMLMMLVAGLAKEADEPPVVANESIARSLLRTAHSAEETFKATKGDGRYGTLEELTKEGLFHLMPPQATGYKFEITVSGGRFEATAVPIEYGKSGRLSYFIDDSGVLRGADHGGGAATISDEPVQ